MKRVSIIMMLLIPLTMSCQNPTEYIEKIVEVEKEVEIERIVEVDKIIYEMVYEEISTENLTEKEIIEIEKIIETIREIFIEVPVEIEKEILIEIIIERIIEKEIEVPIYIEVEKIIEKIIYFEPEKIVPDYLYHPDYYLSLTYLSLNMNYSSFINVLYNYIYETETEKMTLIKIENGLYEFHFWNDKTNVEPTFIGYSFDEYNINPNDTNIKSIRIYNDINKSEVLCWFRYINGSSIIDFNGYKTIKVSTIPGKEKLFYEESYWRR
jgi:hypothetical protein